jgi:hypothetical protein
MSVHRLYGFLEHSCEFRYPLNGKICRLVVSKAWRLRMKGISRLNGVDGVGPLLVCKGHLTASALLRGFKRIERL